MDSPVRLLLSAANTTEREFRENYSYSKQFMVDVSAGTYTRIPDSIHVSLKHLCARKAVPVGQLLLENFGATTLDQAYENYQIIERNQIADKYRSAAPRTWTDELSPAHFYVKATAGSPTRFSKELKVPPQQVRRWVSGQAKTTPESIELALRQIAYPWVRDLVERQAAWVEEHA